MFCQVMPSCVCSACYQLALPSRRSLDCLCYLQQHLSICQGMASPLAADLLQYCFPLICHSLLWQSCSCHQLPLQLCQLHPGPLAACKVVLRQLSPARTLLSGVSAALGASTASGLVASAACCFFCFLSLRHQGSELSPLAWGPVLSATAGHALCGAFAECPLATLPCWASCLAFCFFFPAFGSVLGAPLPVPDSAPTVAASAFLLLFPVLSSVLLCLGSAVVLSSGSASPGWAETCAGFGAVAGAALTAVSAAGRLGRLAKVLRGLLRDADSV